MNDEYEGQNFEGICIPFYVRRTHRTRRECDYAVKENLKVVNKIEQRQEHAPGERSTPIFHAVHSI